MQRRNVLRGLFSAAVCTAGAPAFGNVEGGLFRSGGGALIDLNGNRSPFEPLNKPKPLIETEPTVARQEDIEIEPELARAPPPQARPDDLELVTGLPTLTMYNVHTKEHLRVQPASATGFNRSELDRVNRFMRDWRRNEVKAIDPDAIMGLLRLQKEARRNGFSGEVRFLSGYRSQATNDLLRSKGIGAARNSLHIQAKAIDFSLPGVSIRETIGLAKNLGIGGVGGYSTFVHIDTGRRRFWGTAA